MSEPACRVQSNSKLGGVFQSPRGWKWDWGVWLVQCDERMVGRHLRRGLGWLVLVAPIRLVVVLTAFDLRLLQLPRSRGNHRQDEQEGQDKQVKLMHCCNGGGWTGKVRERHATARGIGGSWLSCRVFLPPGEAGMRRQGWPFKPERYGFGT